MPHPLGYRTVRERMQEMRRDPERKAAIEEAKRALAHRLASIRARDELARQAQELDMGY